MKKISFALFFCLCALAGFAQNSKPLDLKEIVSGEFIPQNISGVIPIPGDGEHYSQMNADKTQIIKYSFKTGKPVEVLFDAATARECPFKKFDSYSFAPDGSKLLIATETVPVYRHSYTAVHYIYSLKRNLDGKINNVVEKLSDGGPQQVPIFSPDGNQVAFVRDNNIFLVKLLYGNSESQVTEDGSRNEVLNGIPDWVYEEEFNCRDGFRWSPDGQYIAYWQSDTQGTGWFDIINNVDSIYPKIQRFPYPKAGTANSAVKVGYVSADGGNTTWLALPGDARNHYIPRMEFIPGCNELFIQQMNRAQNTNKVWIAKIGENTPVNIFTDQDAAWLETNDNVRWLKGNKYFTWESERDGWRHLYRVSRDGKEIKPITQGAFDYIQEVGADMDKGFVYFIASPDNFTQRYLYRARLFGNGEVKRLSPVDQSGQHRYIMSPSGKWAVHTFSNSETPPVIDMVSFPAHKSIRLITDNAKAKEQYKALGLQPKEFVKTRSGELELDAWMLKPVNFDPSKKYPVIIDVYGEPANATVQDVWSGGSLWHQYLANLGYIIVSIENRGANAPRGREWRKCIYGEVGTFASEDQARGIQDLARQYSFIDTARIGITGWSGGGSQTLNSMFRYPDVFHTGIAIAFVADQRLYDTVYQERYMNTPQNNPEGYRKGSPISYAAGLKGNLLLIHGTGDDNVHYQNCEMLVNELVRHGKIFSQISYPMRSHGIYEGKGTSLHLRKTMADYWLKNLPAGGK